MVSIVLVLVARGGLNFWASYKILNLTEGKTQQLHNIIENGNQKKFTYDDYQAIYKFEL